MTWLYDCITVLICDITLEAERDLIPEFTIYTPSISYLTKINLMLYPVSFRVLQVDVL